MLQKRKKWNVFECRPLHCYEAELLDICRQDSTYITVGCIGYDPLKLLGKKTRFWEASSNVSVFGFEFRQKIARNEPGKKMPKTNPAKNCQKQIAKNEPGKKWPKTNLAKNCQKQTRQKIAKNEPGKKLSKTSQVENCRKRTRQIISKKGPSKKLPETNPAKNCQKRTRQKIAKNKTGKWTNLKKWPHRGLDMTL